MIVFVLGYAYMRNHICLWKASSGAEVAFLGHSSGILTDVQDFSTVLPWKQILRQAVRAMEISSEQTGN